MATRQPEHLLEQLALEHRDLGTRWSALAGDAPEDRRGAAAEQLVEHELAHRLLVHPLLRRDDRGRMLLGERREEQLLLADRLGRFLAAGTAVRALQDEVSAHTDREEILGFPHLRRTVAEDELRGLGALRAELRAAVRTALRAQPRLVTHGRWATLPRHELPGELALPDELVERLPAGVGSGDTVDVAALERARATTH